MNYDEINKKLKELKGEEIVWIVYIGIIILSFYSNNLERNFFINNDLKSKEKYRRILIFIFFVLIVVYVYFLKGSYEKIENISPNTPYEQRNLLYLSFIASLLITISGVIFLYIAIKDENLNVEIAFN